MGACGGPLFLAAYSNNENEVQSFRDINDILSSKMSGSIKIDESNHIKHGLINTNSKFS